MLYVLAEAIYDETDCSLDPKAVGWEFTGLTPVWSLAICHVISNTCHHVALQFPDDVTVIRGVTTKPQAIINEVTLEELNDTKLTALSLQWDESGKSHTRSYIEKRLNKEMLRKTEEQRVAVEVDKTGNAHC